MSRNVRYDVYIKVLKDYFSSNSSLEEFGIIDSEASSKALSLLKSMHDVYVAKDSDYSENDLPMGNLRESAELGISPWKGVLLRIGDKKRRIGSFINKESYQVKDEAVEDTLVDMANYSLLGAALFDEIYPSSFNESTWIEMAKFCILIKLSYEHDKKLWIETLWPNVLDKYNQLARIASS